MGDNRDDALDSRYSGFIHRADVIGIAVLGYGSRGVKPVGKSGK